MENETTIVTEGEFDAAVLKTLLKGWVADEKYVILPASGYSSALSKVRSLLTLSNKKVLLLLDTDTTNDDEIKSKKQFVKEYIKLNDHKENFKTIWSVPEFEIIFLNNKNFLNRLTDKKLSNDLIEVGKAAPKRTLKLISDKNQEIFLALLDKKEIRDGFFEQGLIREIYDFIEKE